MAKKNTIFLSGGGTLGSVMPLFALVNELQKNYQITWLGSFRGPEKKFFKTKEINYISIPSGKLRKYFSIKNLFAPLFILGGLLFSFFIFLFNRPKVLIVSGSFISVPPVWSAWLLRIPIIVHQEDINIGLAGKLSIKFTTIVTTAFQETLTFINKKNKFWIGNPVREDFFNVQSSDIKKWKNKNLPLVVILGGGLGAKDINQAIVNMVPEITKYAEIVHITGAGKEQHIQNKNYQQFAFLDKEFYSLLASADIVISRSGLSTITELAILAKPSILIPLKGVGQLENAKYLQGKNACILINQINSKILSDKLLELLKDNKKQQVLGSNIKKIFPSDANKKMIKIIEDVLKK